MATSKRHGEDQIGQYTRLESIGKGSFATVYRAMHPTDKTLVAIKSVHHTSLKGKLKANLFSEIDILKRIQHPHIVALINILESRNHIHLVMEFCQLGDLATFVRKRDKLAAHPVCAEMMRNYPNPSGAGFNEVIVRHFAKQISSAMYFLYSQNLVHRDLKPQNLLLNPPPSYIMQEKPENRPFEVAKDSLVPQAGVASMPVLKIADFGFARHLPQTAMAETLCGSPLYMAPEILRYEKYDNKADLWSIGTVLFELNVGRPPFRAANHVDLLRKIQKGNDNIVFPEGVEISKEMWQLICSLLKQMPTERLGWDAFFKHSVIIEEIPGLVPADRHVQKEPPDSKPQPIASPQKELVEETATSQSPKPSARPTGDRTFSETPTSRPLVNRRLSSVQQQKRPQLTSHATEPAVQGLRTDRASATPAEKRRSQEPPTPPPQGTPPKPDPERRRSVQHARNRGSRDERERAAMDVAFERDYVMVEKRAVEVNAFADEMAASPRLQAPGAMPRNSPTSGMTAMLRRATTQGMPTLNPGQASPSRQTQLPLRPDLQHQRKMSYERNNSERKQSSNSAITAALQNAAYRVPYLFSQPKGVSSPQPYGPFPTFPATPAGPLKIGDASRPLALHEDQQVVTAIEEDATRSDVVFGFAEIKYKQLAPIAPSNDKRLGITKANGEEYTDDPLTMDAVAGISEEALVLYIKALAILTNTIRLAGIWWNQRGRHKSQDETSGSPRSVDASSDKNAEVRINQVVQWARNRFNECLEKSEYAGRRLTEANIKQQSRSRERSRPSSSSSQKQDNAGQTSEIQLSGRVTAEKIMYDRAIDMSRGAAVNELVGQDLANCELSYVTAIRLLEAVLEVDEEMAEQKRKASKKDGSSADEDNLDAIDGIEEQDRTSVLNIIEEMRRRLQTLRKKVEAQKTSRRQRPPSDPAKSPPKQTEVAVSVSPRS